MTAMSDEATPDHAFRALWLAVLARAAEDGDIGYIGSRDFKLVCDLAGVTPEWVACELRAKMARGPVRVRLDHATGAPMSEAGKTAIREGWRRRRERQAAANLERDQAAAA